MNQDKRYTKKNLIISGISACIFTLLLLGIYVMLRIGVFENASYTLEVCLFLGMFVLFIVSILCWYMYLERYLYLQLYALGTRDDSENSFLIFIKAVGIICVIIMLTRAVFSGRYADEQMDDAYFWKRVIESTEEY